MAPGPTVQIDEQGYIRHRVPAGQYRADLVLDGQPTQQSSTIEIGAADTAKDLVLAGMMVSGTVSLDAVDRDAIAANRVWFFVEIQAEGKPAGSKAMTAVVSKDGRFRLIGLPRGRYVVRVGRAMSQSFGSEMLVDVSDRDVAGLSLAPPPK